MFPVQHADPWLDEFEFGQETRRIQADQAKNSLVKSPRRDLSAN